MAKTKLNLTDVSDHQTKEHAVKLNENENKMLKDQQIIFRGENIETNFNKNKQPYIR